MLAHELLDEAAWVAHRDAGRPPFERTALVTSYQSRAEFLVGAWLIDKVVPPQLGGSLLANLQPQMLAEVDTLAAGAFRNAVLMPRRSSKTTTLWCVLLGRCYMRPMHQAGYTMLTLAKKADKRFELDVRDPISRKWRDKRVRENEHGVKLKDGKGGKGVAFENGSNLDILAPKGDEVRSGAYDTLVLDEAGEAEPDEWADIVSSVIPAFDTRPGAQIILAGTAGRYRTGSYFWKTLHDPDAGRIRYGVPDDIDPALLEDWDTVGPLIDKLHPGLDGLTTLDRIAGGFEDLGASLFAAEYLGHFGDEGGNATAISNRAWSSTRQAGPVPEGVTSGALALAVHPKGLYASVVVAWHITGPTDLAEAAWDLDGIAANKPRVGIKLLHHQRGVQGIERVLILASRALGAPIVYDKGTSSSVAVIDRLLTIARPRPRVEERLFAQVKVAHAQLVAGVEHGDIWHWQQKQLDSAAEIGVVHAMGQGYLIRAPKGDEHDITPIEAAALAYDALPARPATKFDPLTAVEFA
ncbi:hypothetical protein [uncultured Microbacterium sp.]|uniref:hypothetical protein n=1 Tax=uncultured Microbacterium sp. TaxID=191216 RepID=UPI00259A436E|nr:hypothetical protein [uncultured Microbacterium sp.]